MNTYFRNGQAITIPLYVRTSDVSEDGSIPKEVIKELFSKYTVGLGLSKNDVENLTEVVLGQSNNFEVLRNLEYISVLSSGAELTYKFLIKVY